MGNHKLIAAISIFCISVIFCSLIYASDSLKNRTDEIMGKAFVRIMPSFAEMKSMHLLEKIRIISGEKVTPVRKDIYIKDDKFRYSSIIGDGEYPIETHIIYDGEVFQIISNVIGNFEKRTDYAEAVELLNEIRDKNVSSGWDTTLSSLMRIREKHTSYNYLGTQMVRGKDCYVIKTVPKSDYKKMKELNAIYYITKDNGIVVKYDNVADIKVGIVIKKFENIQNSLQPMEVEAEFDSDLKVNTVYSVYFDEPVTWTVFDTDFIKIKKASLIKDTEIREKATKEVRANLINYFEYTDKIEKIKNNMKY